MNIIFFESWGSIFHIIFTSTISYVYLIVVLLISGKRTLSKMNAFDIVVTIALGSVFATAILSRETIPVFNVFTALTILVLLQFTVTWCSVRSKKFAQLVKSSPCIIFHNGKIIEKNVRKERLTLEEIQSALRKNGVDSLENTQTVILETDGSLTVIAKTQNNNNPLSQKNLPDDV